MSMSICKRDTELMFNYNIYLFIDVCIFIVYLIDDT